MRRARAQLVLLAAAVVVAALVPMLLAYAQLSYHADVRGTSDVRASVANAERVLERAVRATSADVEGTVAPGEHERAAGRVDDGLDPAITRLESSGAGRDLTVSVERNATAARRWAVEDCPGGPVREFGPCVVTDGVVTQNRANSTAVVAVGFDLHVRGPRATADATVVVRAVGGVASG